MSHDLKIFVVDTGPLITLAAAQSLDYLLYVEADIVIPDAVLHEATFDAARLGAQDIIDWVKVHRLQIEIAPTKAYQVFDAARAGAYLTYVSPTWANVRRLPKSSRSPTACAATSAAYCCVKKRRCSGGS